MNVITRGTNSTVYFTLTERRTLTSPFYLVRAESLTTRTVKRFILASDLSAYPTRYNKFTITESGTENLTSGVVELTPAGDWSYRVYEQTSSTSLNELLSTTLLEEGIFKVQDSSESNTYLFYDGQDKTYNV